MSVARIQTSSHTMYWEGVSKKKQPAKVAVLAIVTAVYILFVENVFVTCLHITAAARRSKGFMKFDPKGVEAAKTMSPTSKPTSKQIASGPLVINPVMVPILLLFFRHSMHISMAKPMQSISTIIPTAPAEASRTFPPKSRELPIKKTRTRAQATRSRRPTEFFRNIFKV